MGLPMLVVGGYWYVRAAIKTGGNPIPITKFGPLHLPTPDQMPLDPRPRFAVAHYLTDPTIYRRVVLPRTRQRLRAVMAADPDRRRRRRGLHRLALAQQDPAGDRRGGAGDRGRLRLHAADRGRPAELADRLLHQHALPDAGADPGDRDAADRAAAARAREARLADALFLTAVYWITVLTTPRWYPTYILGTIFITLVLVWAPTALSLGRVRGAVSRSVVAVALGVILLLAVVLGRAQQVQYADQHYTKVEPLPRRRGAAEKPTNSPRSCTTSGSGSPARARSSSASTASSATTPPTTSSSSASPARTAPTAWRPTARPSAAKSTAATTTT